MKCTTHNHGTWWWTPCMWATAALLAWTLASTYWYVCEIQQFCTAKIDKPAMQAVVPAANLPVVETADTTWKDVSMNPLVVHFAANSDRVLTEEIETTLANIVSYMKSHSDAKILVTGHTNVHSSTVYTDALGKTRAEKVKALLVEKGAPAGNIATSSMGQRELAGSPKTAEGRYENRRAVVSIIK